MMFCLLPELIFASFCDRFWTPFRFVLGSAFGASKRYQNVIQIRCENWHGENRFRGGLVARVIPGLVARRGPRGEVPLGGRRFGRKEEKKKGNKKERKI